MTKKRATARRATSSRRPYEQLVIQDVRPSGDGGRLPVKAIVGERLTVEATVCGHGHLSRARLGGLAGSERLRVAALEQMRTV